MTASDYYKQLSELQYMSRIASSPLLSAIETLDKQYKKLNPESYTQAIRAYSTLADLYRLPGFIDSSAVIRYDAEDGERMSDTSSACTSSESERTAVVFDNTHASELNRANQEYLDYLRSRSEEIATAILRTDFEDGMDNDVTLLIKSFAKKNKSATYNWIEELYSKHLAQPSVVQGLLRTLAMITEKGDENILLPIVVAGLRSESSAEQEAAIMVIEEWRTKECLDAICSVTNFSSELIANYAKIVKEELKNELEVC